MTKTRTSGPGTRPDVAPAVGRAKPWLKATALVSVSTSGVVTGMTIAPGPAAAMTSPSSVPAKLPAGLQSALQAHLLADRATAAADSAQRAPEPSSQQAFIGAVAPGAIAAEQRYGVPASVTIAQAIDESDWGRSLLAAREHNLFGIKGSGPAGSVTYQTSEFEGGRWVQIDASFRAYHNVAESIEDHAALLATSGYYTRAMADRASPDAFANALAGVYATDPNYGATLIALMRSYDLYRYDAPAPAPAAPPASGKPPAPAVPPASHAPGKPPAPAPAKRRTPSRKAAPAKAAARRTAASPIIGSDVVPVLVPAAQAPHAASAPRAASAAANGTAAIPGVVTPETTLTAYYQPHLPDVVTTAFTTTAGPAIAHLEPLYRDAATRAGISWKILAACDWMQCGGDPRFSPVYGEKLGTVNPDGSCYATKSQALARCAADLTELASAVYGIDLTVKQPMSVRALAEVFAAYRWGGILLRHGVSAMEFPYSVAGLTAAHTGMRWPAISDPDAPDRPGSKFRQPFGAVPVLLCLGYPATV